MQCLSCGKEIPEGADCPKCGRPAQDFSRRDAAQAAEAAQGGPVNYQKLLGAIEAGVFPAHVEALDLSLKMKRAFTFYEGSGAIQPGGFFPALPKSESLAFRQLSPQDRRAVMRLLMTRVWWSFFFGPFYHLCMGMWRKALVLIGGTLAIGFAFDVLWAVFSGGANIPRGLDLGISLAFAMAMSLMAPYDLYRFRLKRETFWW